MQFQLTKEVIDSIKLARDFQLAKEPESGDASALARLAFNNGHRLEMILNLKKLAAWTRTFKQGQFDGSFKAELIDASQVGERDYAGWLQVSAALTENRSSELKMCPGGLTYAEPIEVQIVDGVAQIVASPGGATELKAIRAANRIESRRLKLQAAVRSLESNLLRVQTYRDKEAQTNDEALTWLASHDLWDATQNARLRRDQAREVRRIEAKLAAGESVKDDLLALGLLARPELPRADISPPTSRCFNCNQETGKTPAVGYWPVCSACEKTGAAEIVAEIITEPSAVADYDRYWAVFLEAKRKHDAYKPKAESWRAQEERDRRKKKMAIALRPVQSIVWRELREWRDALNALDISGYAGHRKAVRKWRRIERETGIEIEQFEQDLRVARSALEEFEAANPPKTEPERSEQIESHPDLTIQLLDPEGIDHLNPLAEIAREAQESWQTQAAPNLIAKPSEPVTSALPALSNLETKPGPDAPTPFNQPTSTATAERKSIMEVKIEGKHLVITIPLQAPAPSASGKTLVIASSRGNVKTSAMIDGKPITIGVNAYIQR